MRLELWLRNAETTLRGAGIQSALLEAQVLAAHALNADRSTVLAHPEWDIDGKAADILLARRASHEPLAYILGYREFYGRRFHVTPDVLIPRQETETLVNAFLEVEAHFPSEARILDLGTGSGCIGITLKLERPSLSVTLSDIADGPLQIAENNAKRLRAEVTIIKSDGFYALAGQQFDVIGTNPPYVAESDPLPDEVRLFEPAGALYSGATGLEFYERLASEADHFLAARGLLMMEIGDGQADAVRVRFTSSGWNIVKAWRDLSGKERVVAVSPSRAPLP